MPRKKTSHRPPVSAYDLFKIFPPELLRQIGQQTSVDANVSHLHGALMLQLLMIGMLDGNPLSTRLLSEHYGSKSFERLFNKNGHQTRHSSIASRLSTMEVDYFKQLFEWLYERFSGHFEHSRLGKKVARFDSTMVAISSALVDFGMKVGPKSSTKPRKHQLKFTLELHGRLPKSIKLFTDQEMLSEQSALRQAITQSTLKPGDYIVFDAGLTHRQTFVAFEDRGIGFVSKLKAGYRAEVVETYRQIKGRKADGLRFERDEVVYLYGSGNKLVKHKFRLVVAHDEAKDRQLAFITNVWDLSAMDVARLYRSRWDIEVFFRFLKQELNFSRLINRTKNGIQIQMYVALITAILLVAFKELNKIENFRVARLRMFYQIQEAAELIDRQLAQARSSVKNSPAGKRSP